MVAKNNIITMVVLLIILYKPAKLCQPKIKNLPQDIVYAKNFPQYFSNPNQNTKNSMTPEHP